MKKKNIIILIGVYQQRYYQQYIYLKALKNADNEDCNNNSYNLNLTFDNNITDKKLAANYNLVVKTIAEDEEVKLKINTKLEITKESSILQINISNAKKDFEF